MGRQKADLTRSDDYADAVRLQRVAEQVSRWTLGYPHARRIHFEDHRFDVLDDLVEEYGTSDGTPTRIDGWQIKRNTATTDEKVLRDAINDLKKEPTLRAVIVTRDPTNVRHHGSLGQLGSLAELCSAPGFDLARVDSLYDTQRRWLVLIAQAIGDGADLAASVAMLRRIRVEPMGTASRLREHATAALRSAYKDADAALLVLARYVEQARDPAVSVTPEVVARVLANLELRDDCQPDRGQPGVQQLRPTLRAHALTLIADKASVTMGASAQPLPRLVVRLDEQAEPAPGKRQPQAARLPMRLRDAIELERRVLMLGDMGEGKSTACATLMVELCEAPDAPIPVLVPGGYFTSGDVPSTASSLLRRCSEYLADEVDSRLAGVDLDALLRRGTDVLLILDSLDEAGLSQSLQLVTAASAAVRAHQGLAVLATARPNEARVPRSPRWTRIGLHALGPIATRALLAQAARRHADQATATSRAAAVDARLQRSPTLRAFAGTPMVTLMLGEALQTGLTEDDTVGDLVRRFVFLRLGEWDEESGRRGPEAEVVRALPDVTSRVRLLSRLSAEMAGRPLASDRAIDLIQDTIAPEPRKTAVGVLEYLCDGGLVVRSAGEVNIPLATISQWLGGFRIADAVAAGARPAVETNRWRDVAFAAGELRRRRQQERHHDWLLACVDTLSGERLIPAAAMVVSEARDVATASQFVKGVSSVGDRPLWVFEEDRGESSNAIGSTIALAGDAGFRWFFDSYLEPRNPYLLGGSAIIDAIFETWCLRVGGAASEEQKDHLDRMRRAVSGTQVLAALRKLPPLVFVMPERLPRKMVVECLVEYLGKPAVEHVARQHLEEHILACPGTVSDACLRATAKGYESALATAEVWLQLNPEGFHTSVADGVLGARQRLVADDPRWPTTLARLRERVGEARFVRYLRWALIVGGAPATGAAFALAQYGERRLHVLGDAVLHGLHGGVNCDGAEDLAHLLMEANSSSSRDWLIARFTKERRSGFRGAHAGWWRLLLTELECHPDGGPAAFAQCIRDAAGFLLPRHADLRVRFGRLLQDTSSPYRTAVDTALHSSNLRARQGAAMLLVACIEPPPLPALIEVLRSFDGHSENPWEWEEFLLGIPLTREDAEFLLRNPSRLGPHGRGVARLLARETSRGLDVEEEAALVRDALAGHISLIDRGSLRIEIVSSSIALQVCRSEIAVLGPHATAAAETLLRHHADKLPPAERARVAVVATSGGFWRIARTANEYRMARRDAAYGRLLREQSRLFDETHATGSVLSLLLEERDASQWEPVLARIFLGGGHRDGEEPADFLLRADLSVATMEAIANAASALLSRALERGGGVDEGVFWLALLAHQHGADVAEHVDALAAAASNGSYSAAASALRARARTLPEYTFRSKVSRPSFVTPRHLPTGDGPSASDAISAVARVAAPDTPSESGAADSLLFYALSGAKEVQLDRSSANAPRWALLQGAIDWLEGHNGRPDVLAAGFPDLFVREKSGGDTLKDWWVSAYRDSLRASEEIRTAVIDLLRGDLLWAVSDRCAVGSELLSWRGAFMDDEVPLALRGLVEPSIWCERLVESIAVLIGSGVPVEQVPIMRAVIDEQLLRMDALDDEDVRYDAPDVALGLALSAWIVGTNEGDAAERVFVRGLTALLRRKRRLDPMDRDVLATLSPLFQRVDKRHLRDALEAGARAGTPEIRSICLLFIAGLGLFTTTEMP